MMNNRTQNTITWLVLVIALTLLLFACQSNEPLFSFSENYDFYEASPTGEQQAIEMLNEKYFSFVYSESDYSSFHDLHFTKIDEDLSQIMRGQICEIIKKYFNYSPYSSVSVNTYGWSDIESSIDEDPLFNDYNANRKEARITTILSDAIIVPLSYGKHIVDGNKESILVYGAFNCRIYSENEAQFNQSFKYLHIGPNGIESWFLFQYHNGLISLKSILVYINGKDGCQLTITQKGISLKECR